MNKYCGKHNPYKQCKIEGCESLGSPRGHCSSCGMYRRNNLCNKHDPRNKEIQREYGKFRRDECEICHTKLELTVHHKDENFKNNNKDNLQTLCRKCHDEVHGIKPRKWRATPIVIARIKV